MSAFLYTNCPNCGKPTVQHLTPEGQYWCQDCEGINALKPGDIVKGGQGRQVFAPTALQLQIQKEIDRHKGKES